MVILRIEKHCHKWYYIVKETRYQCKERNKYYEVQNESDYHRPQNTKDNDERTFFDLECEFAYDEEQYGNGHYVSIKGKESYQQIIDLRYDKTFDRNNKEKWLENWARNYWSGENGAWAIKTLEIAKSK